MEPQYKVFIDCETSGLSFWDHDIIELACIVVNEENKQIGEFCERAKPEGKWSDEAEQIHGISRSDLSESNSQHDLAFNFVKFISSFKQHDKKTFQFVDHSLRRFDYRHLKALFFKQNIYYDFYKYFRDENYDSTINMARQSRYSYSNYKLSTLCDYHGITYNSHVAYDDALACFKIWKIYKEVF